MTVTAEGFEVNIAEERLADLMDRLKRTRLPTRTQGPDWGGGVDLAYMSDLVDYWRSEFDWRAQEAQMNRHEHWLTRVNDVSIHFMRRRGVGPDPLPIVLTHGWPWTFWDFQYMIEPLADPARFGGDPADAFDVIVPSLPGYAFSAPSSRPAIPAWDVADLWVGLMQEALGYERFAVHAGDMGAFVAAQLGHKYPEHIIGLHLAPRPLRLDMTNVARPWTMFAGVEETEEQQAWVRRKIGHVVAHILSPETLSVAMQDSPVGLAAWLVERRRDWSDCGGDVERAFSRDFLLTNFSLFWLTDSFTPSVRQYRANWLQGWTPSHERTPVVEAPTGFTLFSADAPPGASNDWLGDYFNVQFLSESDTGGHFAAAEQPERLIADLRTFYRPLRATRQHACS